MGPRTTAGGWGYVLAALPGWEWERLLQTILNFSSPFGRDQELPSVLEEPEPLGRPLRMLLHWPARGALRSASSPFSYPSTVSVSVSVIQVGPSASSSCSRIWPVLSCSWVVSCSSCVGEGSQEWPTLPTWWCHLPIAGFGTAVVPLQQAGYFQVELELGNGIEDTSHGQSILKWKIHENSSFPSRICRRLL